MWAPGPLAEIYISSAMRGSPRPPSACHGLPSPPHPQLLGSLLSRRLLFSHAARLGRQSEVVLLEAELGFCFCNMALATLEDLERAACCLLQIMKDTPELAKDTKVVIAGDMAVRNYLPYYRHDGAGVSPHGPHIEK